MIWKNEYIVSLICILCGFMVLLLIFFAVSNLIAGLFKVGEMHLDKGVFGRVKKKDLVDANEEEEKNLVPLEEALMINDHKRLRGLVMKVIKGNVESSLSAISLALVSRDSETSHYAASVLSRELGEFRLNVQKLLREIRTEEEEHPWEKKRKIRYEHMLFEYLYKILGYRVFTDAEQQSFIRELKRTGERLYMEGEMTALMEAELAQFLLEESEYEAAATWCYRARAEDPLSLDTYQCMLKYLFLTRQKEEFFSTLQSLKTSGINIDRETLDMIRAF